MKNRILLLALILVLFTTPFTVIAEEASQAGPSTDQTAISDQAPSDQTPSDQAPTDQTPTDQAPSEQVPQDNIVTTKHTALIQGKELSYTANAGTMCLKTGGETCEIFFTAYTLDDVADPADRPVTFAFNGGPGACSMFLHTGCFGPRRIDVDENGYTLSMPTRMKDNNNSLLDITDIVFIDAPGTGYSQPVGGSDLSAFIGYGNDVRTFGDFIYQYINRNGRWLSRKYVAGESYGTTRAVGICDYLAEMYSVNLNGIMLISSINDVSALMFGGSNEMPYATFIPTFAADAWYHGVVAEEYRDMALEDYLTEVRSFVENEYVPALFKGSGLTEDEKDTIAERYAGYTGLSKDYVLSVNLRVELDDFCAELLKEQKLMVGRYDGRITGPVTSGSLDNGDSDPSNAAFTLGFGNTFNDYLTRELGFHTDKPYIPMNSDVNSAWTFPIGTWGGYLNQQETVYECISKNPFLKVWVLCGYYDAATPFYSAEWVFRHVFLDEAHSDNLSFTYYPCGHMIYMEKESFDKFRKDAEAWYNSVSPESLYQAGEDAVDAMDYTTALDYFQQAADQGSADAIRSIGNLYADGNGVEKDMEKAHEYWLRAVDLGNTKALLNLGNIYARGEGVEQDSEKARELYQKAIDLGNTDGYVSLGNMYYYGFGVEQDFAKAMEYWQLAADQDNTRALNNIAYLYGHGEGVELDFDKAMEYYQKAVELDDAEAMGVIGNMYLFGDGVEQDYSKAREWYEKAAEKGEALAQANLGWMYHSGTGVEQDYDKALEYYQLAADQGYVSAQSCLGYMYETGEGVEQDYTKALEYYQPAADQGDADAQSSLAFMYETGMGVEQDLKKALELYELAADQGDARAQSGLGYMYETGTGVEQDYAKALEYYQLAVDQGDAQGQNNIGDMYENGHGVEQDFEKAMEYYQLAADQEFAPAFIGLGDLYRDGKGVEQSLEKAKEYYQKALELGEEAAEERIKRLE